MARGLRSLGEQERRAERDEQYIQAFATHVRALFPNCPPGGEQTITEHACRKYTGRIGRSAAAKAFDEDAVRLAVIAHIRHRETNYDDLLGKGWDRFEARDQVRDQVKTICDLWASR